MLTRPALCLDDAFDRDGLATRLAEDLLEELERAEPPLSRVGLAL